MYDILLVEDNEELAGLLRDFLVDRGYSVLRAARGDDAVRYAERGEVRLVLLDIMLPGMDGFAVCRQIRKSQNVPVLIMSAKSGKQNKLTGYELGADDYMEKPVDPEILSAKVNALLKRSGRAQEEMLLVSGEITLNRKARTVNLRGKSLELNVKEYELLLLFVRNPGKTLRKEYIFGNVWGTDSFSESQTLTVHIKMLRAKIEENPREPKRILTVWGVGYRYEEI
ncbi:response regulator transcription factor [[Clostridium] hylemonae]|uniref:response regulator transcription factor n=1 Tax=[Clostridium] hylemonae TaxID=89153 RepID=UPI001D086CB0|nr:response regulator transcription factor [[Clostridium] hylemonae]MCB7521160.1 response regulator transcription factor [[Clostridium] hylemonae]